MTKEVKNNEEENNRHCCKPLLATGLIPKDRRHSHFWISNGDLFESYHTIRGMRYRHILAVNGLPDTDKCQDDIIKYIESEYFS